MISQFKNSSIFITDSDGWLRMSRIKNPFASAKIRMHPRIKWLWLFAISIFLLIVFLPGYTKLQELRDRNRDLESKIIRLKRENVILQQEIKRIENDPLYQEKIVREKMGVVRKGEVPVKIIPEER